MLTLILLNVATCAISKVKKILPAKGHLDTMYNLAFDFLLSKIADIDN